MPKNSLASQETDRRSHWQAIVSILLIVHLFFLFTALSSTWTRSPLQSRILSKFAFYTRTFNLDADFAPDATAIPSLGTLTRADLLDVDHRIEVLPQGGDPESPADWIVLPDVGRAGGERYQRYQRLARVLDHVAERDEDAARIVRAVADHFLQQRGIAPAQIRCRRHLLQSWEQVASSRQDERDPNHEMYFNTPYAADILILRDDVAGVMRNLDASQVAPPGEREDSDTQP